MTGYYDYVLGFIPLALLSVTGLLTTLGLPLTTSVALGASVSFVAVAHAMFVNAPVDDVVTSAPSTNPVNAD
jgi:hypothetical protein